MTPRRLSHDSLTRAHRMSREFLAVGVPLTPELARLHSLDTAKVARPATIELETGRHENTLARRIKKQHVRTMRIVVAIGALAGMAAGWLALELVVRP